MIAVKLERREWLLIIERTRSEARTADALASAGADPARTRSLRRQANDARRRADEIALQVANAVKVTP